MRSEQSKEWVPVFVSIFLAEVPFWTAVHTVYSREHTCMSGNTTKMDTDKFASQNQTLHSAQLSLHTQTQHGSVRVCSRKNPKKSISVSSTLRKGDFFAFLFKTIAGFSSNIFLKCFRFNPQLICSAGDLRCNVCVAEGLGKGGGDFVKRKI